MLRKIIIAILFVSLYALAQSQPVKTHGKLKVEGVQLKNEKGQAVVLRGMSFGWHNWWPRFYTGGAVKWLVDDWACTVVRAAMGIEPDGAYKSRKEWSINTIKTVIDAAIRENVYVIIDWHSHNINLAEAKEYFAAVSKEYGKYPHVIYEIFNEPDQESWKDVKEYSIELIKTIRANDPDNIILIGSPHWDQDIHLVADDPITGYDNIMYTLHFYAATHKKWLRDRGDYAIKKGIPIFVSECAGMEATGNGPLNLEEWNSWIEWMEANKLSWVTWSVSDKDETCSVLLPSANSNGGWKESDLKESGKVTRGLIRKYEKKDP
jgi:endoglucanase